MRFTFRYWLPIAFVITIIFPTMYALTQQSLRQSAYDPQIQMAVEIGNSLASGASATQSFLPKIELTRSLTPFVIVYDKQGKVVTSTATLYGKTPQLPAGVLEYARTHGQDRFTWQPASNVRMATIVSHYKWKNEGYVLTGRSLLEVEKRIERILTITIFGWLVALAGSFILTMLFVKTPKK